MTKNQKTQIETILLALLALVRESGGTDEPVTLPPDSNASPGPVTSAPEPKRHRRTKEQIAADNAAAEAAAKAGAGETEKTALEQEAERIEKAAKEPVTGGKTYEELQAIIRPVVTGNKEKGILPQGPAVKAVIAKYSAAGTLQDLATSPEKHAAFIADIEALTY